jgi:hypothetical protein
MLRQYQRAHGGSYRTLDNRQDQEAALADPVAFAVDGESPRLIDEVHLGGDWLVRAIKIAVDEDPRPGRFMSDVAETVRWTGRVGGASAVTTAVRLVDPHRHPNVATQYRPPTKATAQPAIRFNLVRSELGAGRQAC